MLLLAVGFVAAGWLSVQRLNMLWDEARDLEIAMALVDDPLFGIGDDGSQMRLPMYVNAAVLTITGESLAVTRAISLAVGAATIVLTYLLAREVFGAAAGVLAAALLATSPYFLAFGRIGMTEGDVFAAAGMTLAMLAFVRYLRRPDARRLAWCGLCLALALGAKLYALALLPAFAAVLLFGRRDEQRATGAPPSRGYQQIGHLLAAGVICVATVYLSWRGWRSAAVSAWLVALALWAATFLSLVLTRDRLVGWRAWVLIALLGGVGLAVLMPTHVLCWQIARDVLHRGRTWDGAAPLTGAADHLRLYAGVLWIKLTPGVGALATLGLLWGAWRARRDRAVAAMMLSMVLFVAGILVLPLQQTFYLMSVVPLLFVVTAGMVVTAVRRMPLGRRARAIVAATVLAGLFVHVGWEMRRCWPDVNLYGWHWVGTRWLGAESRGYRNLVNTPCDGTDDLIDWCRRHVEPGQTVVSYLWADHVIDRRIGDVDFTLIRRNARALGDVMGPPIDTADYLLLHVNNRVFYGDAPAPEQIARFYDPTPAFTVFRDDGFEMAWVYRGPAVDRGR